MYQNTNFNNKWFYAFITKMEYVNDGRTDIYIETDVWQTWFNQITLKPSFVEREHVMDDTIGSNTLEENIDTGEFVIKNHSYIEDYLDTYVIVASNYNPYTKARYAGIGCHNGVINGCQFFAFEYYDTETFTSELTALQNFIKDTNTDSRLDDIQGMFAVPKSVIGEDQIDPETRLVKNTTFNSSTSSKKSYTTKKNTSIDGYTPKNNKLFCYPYNYLLVTNNSGSSMIYKYEDFYYYEDGEKTEEFDIKEVALSGEPIALALKSF